MAYTSVQLEPGALWREFVVHLKKNLPLTVVFAVVGALGSYLVNVYWIAKRYEGTNVPGGAPVTAGGNMMAGTLFWIVASGVIFGVVAHWRAVGTQQFGADVRGFPGALLSLSTADGARSRIHLLWGFAVGMVLTQVLSPSLRGVLAVGVVLTVPSVLGRILLGYVSRLWNSVTKQLTPDSARSAPPLVSTAVGALGAALAMAIGFVVDDTPVELAIAAVCAGAAFVMSQQQNGSSDGGDAGTPTVGLVFVVIAGSTVLAWLLLGEEIAFADDGGYIECGSSWSEWWSCDGASDVRSDALVGGIAGAAGATAGAGAGSAAAGAATAASSAGGPSSGGSSSTNTTDPSQPLDDETGAASDNGQEEPEPYDDTLDATDIDDAPEPDGDGDGDEAADEAWSEHDETPSEPVDETVDDNAEEYDNTDILRDPDTGQITTTDDGQVWDPWAGEWISPDEAQRRVNDFSGDVRGPEGEEMVVSRGQHRFDDGSPVPPGWVYLGDGGDNDGWHHPADADEIIRSQRGDVTEQERQEAIDEGTYGIFDPLLDRTVYLGSAAELERYADEMNRRTSEDFWRRTQQDWEERRPAFEAERQAEAEAMARDRQTIESIERAQEQHRQRVLDGISRIDDPELAERIAQARASGDFSELESIYSDHLWDQQGQHRQEYEDAISEAARMRAAELGARAVEAASRSALTVLSTPAGAPAAFVGLTAISAAGEGATAHAEGKEAGEVIARTGFGVVTGMRDAAMTQLSRLPGLPPGSVTYTQAVSDYADTYARARMDGATHEEATERAEVAFGSSVVSSAVGGPVGQIPNAAAREAAELTSATLLGGATSMAQGGDFLDGALDAGASALGGRAGASGAGRIDTSPPSPDQAVVDAAAESKGRSRGEIPLEEQGALVREAFERSEEVSTVPGTRIVIDENGDPQTQIVPRGNTTQRISDPRTVLEGLTATDQSRTAKQAPQDVRDAVVNTRAERIYAEPDRRTIDNALADPRMRDMLRPGDEVMMDTFSTPGKPPSLGADRDARMVIVRPDATAPGGRRVIEVPLEIWERDAYTQFADQARTIYGGDDQMPPRLQAEIDERSRRIAEELDAHRQAHPDSPVWTEDQIRDRAISEAHNQLFTDRRHPEASQANTDQAEVFRSRASQETIASTRQRLVEEGMMRDGDAVSMRRGPNGDEMHMRTVAGDDMVVPRQLWEDEHAQNQATFGDEVVAVPGNQTSETLQAIRGTGRISDPVDYARMWEEKSRFYAGLNEPEAVAQSQKGIHELIAIREGYRQQGLELPQLDPADQRAMQVVLEAKVGVHAAPEGEVERRLQEIYGPDASLAESLGKIAMAHEQLADARPSTTPPPAPGTVTSSTILRSASQSVSVPLSGEGDGDELDRER